MPNLTAADLASRTMRKGWVHRSDEEDHRVAAEDAREAAAGRLKRSGARYKAATEDMQRQADIISAAQTQRKRRSPLYDRDEED